MRFIYIYVTFYIWTFSAFAQTTRATEDEITSVPTVRELPRLYALIAKNTKCSDLQIEQITSKSYIYNTPTKINVTLLVEMPSKHTIASLHMSEVYRLEDNEVSVILSPVIINTDSSKIDPNTTNKVKFRAELQVWPYQFGKNQYTLNCGSITKSIQVSHLK